MLVVLDGELDKLIENWTQTLLANLEEAGLAIPAETEEAKPLLGLLHEHESAALLGRIERMLKTKRYPVPGQARHYPWPMV